MKLRSINPRKRAGALHALMAAVLLATLPHSSVFSQAQEGAFIKDEVFFSVARKLNQRTDSPVSAIVASLSEVIEVVSVTPGPEGLVTAVVKEKSESNPRSTNKSIKLTFLPSGEKNKWKWESFEDNRKLYEVEKLFPYAKERLDKGREQTNQRWEALLVSVFKVGEAATKVLETAKAVLKKDMPATATILKWRVAFAEAAKEGSTETLAEAQGQLDAVVEEIPKLGEENAELKANDAYLRLIEELKTAQTEVRMMRKLYIDSVNGYNDDLQRLPFSLVAYGMEYTRLEPKMRPE